MEEKIETSKNHFANKTRIISVVDVINLAAMNYRSVFTGASENFLVPL